MMKVEIAQHHIPPHACPHCGTLLDMASSVPGEVRRPQPDDLTFCIKCGELSQFDAELVPHKLSAEQMRAAQAAIPNLSRMIAAMRISAARQHKH